MEKYSLTFGAGSRTCVGKNISLMVCIPHPLEVFVTDMG
jgi:hypothetical protein